jgi:hypothetical protein
MSRPVRTLLAAVVLAALIVTGVAIVIPVIVRPMVIDAVRAALPFGDEPLDIDIDLNVFGLIQGTVDRIHVHGTDLASGDVQIGALDATATDVTTTGHAFRAVDATVSTVAVPTVDGDPITVREITLHGSGSSVAATARLDAGATVQLIIASFADAGVDVGGVELGDGIVSFDIFGQRAGVPIGVEDGAIVLVNPFGTGSFELVTPSADDPWRFTGVAVTPAGLEIDAEVDAARLLGQG